MNIQRRKKLMIRWTVLSFVLTACFWTSWYLIVGSVPVVKSLKMTENWTLQLPFAISGWTDVLFAPFLFIFIIWLITFEKPKKISEEGWVVGIVVGVLVCLCAGVLAGINAGIVAGIILSIFAGVLAGISAGISAGIVAGIVVSIVVGIVAGIVVGIGGGIGAGIASLLKTLFFRDIWKKLDIG